VISLLDIPANKSVSYADTEACKSSPLHHIFGISDNGTKVREAGFEFETIESDTLPTGALCRLVHEMIRSNHFGALRLQGDSTEGHTLVQRSSLDGLIVDLAEVCGGSVAEGKVCLELGA